MLVTQTKEEFRLGLVSETSSQPNKLDSQETDMREGRGVDDSSSDSDIGETKESSNKSKHKKNDTISETLVDEVGNRGRFKSIFNGRDTLRKELYVPEDKK